MELKSPEKEMELGKKLEDNSKNRNKMLTSKEREIILDKIKKAGSEEYVTEWTKEGKIGVQKKKSEMKKGKKSKISGRQFEIRVREDLEINGWIVARWTNNIEFEEGVEK
jgi:transposase